MLQVGIHHDHCIAVRVTKAGRNGDLLAEVA